MILAPHETARYFRVWWPLLRYVNERLHVVDEVPPYPGARANADEAIKLRDALWSHDSLRKQFLLENPAGLPPEDLALVESWSGRLAGQFYLYRHLQKHSVVLPAGGAKRAYGVLGLTDPLSQLIRQPPPVLLGMVLLPFEDRIIYDGLLTAYRITSGLPYRASGY